MKQKSNLQILKEGTLIGLRSREEIFVLMSACTNMPYVACHPETYDDQVLLYYKEDDAHKEAKRLTEAGSPASVSRVDGKVMLQFYNSLFLMGANCLKVNRGMENEIMIQLADLVRRPAGDSKDQMRVENPQLHLTALYLAQEQRSSKPSRSPEEMRELQEEVMVHFSRGRYLIASEEERGIPLLKTNDGKVYQPIFTDAVEFKKFDRENKLKAGIVEFGNLGKAMAKEATGVSINPMGANLMIQLEQRLTPT